MALRMASVPLAGSLCSVTGVPNGSVCRRRVRINCGASNVPRNGKMPATAALKPAADAEEKTNSIPGLVFEPLREVQGQVTKLQKNLHASLARQRFQVSCETAINEQINVEYNVSYIYHALFSYFDRDNVALPGLAKYFKDSSDEERQHAEMFMKYQNKRGGRVQLQSIILPPMDFANEEKGDALYAMELTLALEKLTTEKLYDLHKAAEDVNDVQLQDYVESEFLAEQVEAIKIVSEYVSQLRRIGNDGHGVYHWDRVLLEEIAKPAVPAAPLGGLAVA